MPSHRRFVRCELEALEDRRVLTATVESPMDTASTVTDEQVEVAVPIDPSHGNPHAAIEVDEGDFNADGLVDADDIDLLCSGMSVGAELLFDLTGDGIVDQADMDMMIHEVLDTSYGDANLDGEILNDDVKVVFSNIFQTGTGWATGDFTCDNRTDSLDFIEWNRSRNETSRLAAPPAPDADRAVATEDGDQSPLASDESVEAVVPAKASARPTLVSQESTEDNVSHRSSAKTTVENVDGDEHAEDGNHRFTARRI